MQFAPAEEARGFFAAHPDIQLIVLDASDVRRDKQLRTEARRVLHETAGRGLALRTGQAVVSDLRLKQNKTAATPAAGGHRGREQ